MRFGRGNLRGGNLIVETLNFPYFLRLPRQIEVVKQKKKTLIFPYFLRLPRQIEVVTYEVTYVVTMLDHNLSFCRSICILFLLYPDVAHFISQIFDFLKNFVYRKDPFTTDSRNSHRQN